MNCSDFIFFPRGKRQQCNEVSICGQTAWLLNYQGYISYACLSHIFGEKQTFITSYLSNVIIIVNLNVCFPRIASWNEFQHGIYFVITQAISEARRLLFSTPSKLCRWGGSHLLGPTSPGQMATVEHSLGVSWDRHFLPSLFSSHPLPFLSPISPLTSTPFV